jgi:copper(I)-binding protein
MRGDAAVDDPDAITGGQASVHVPDVNVADPAYSGSKTAIGAAAVPVTHADVRSSPREMRSAATFDAITDDRS